MPLSPKWVNIRWKDLEEIYNTYMLLHRSDHNTNDNKYLNCIQQNFVNFLAFSTLGILNNAFFNFVASLLISLKFARIFSK